MKRNVLIGTLVTLVVIVVFVFVVWKPKKDAAVIFINGLVYTVNHEMPHAEALAIQDGLIAGVGSSDDILSSFSSPQIIDLKGEAVYPGFIDAHGHLEGLGAYLITLDLVGAPSVEYIQERIRQRLAPGEVSGWLRGRGWDQNLWTDKSFPTASMLDEVVRDIPVLFIRIDGHAIWVNTKAMELAGVTAATQDPDGGRIERDAAGNPTGVFVDKAMNLILSFLPPPTEKERSRAIELAVKACLRIGLTQVHDMGVDLDGIEIYRSMIEKGEFPFRVYVALDGLGDAWRHYLDRGPDLGGKERKLIVRALKLYTDGALGSRGAALIEPYTDDPHNRGLTLISQDSIVSAAEQAIQKGFQVCTHAIGDRGNHIVLNSYEKAIKNAGRDGNEVRFRIEHAQIIYPPDIQRFGQLGVIPSMQPIHCTSDMYWVGDRLGSEREQGAYAWRSLISSGSIIPGGSDFPVEDPNPLLGFYAAITRQDMRAWPPGGWHPEERMTREEALKAFTLWAAYAGFQEGVNGSLEVGKFADLVVLNNDIMKVEPRRILETKVDITMVAGKVAYSSGSLFPATE